MSRSVIANIPNVLSFSRLGLAIVFPFARAPQIRLALILAAAATDYLDGWIARRSNTTNPLGALIDPIADRMFVFVAVSVFLAEGTISVLQYFVLISRDLMTAIGFVVAKSVSWLRTVRFRARVPGKLVTVLQLAALISILIRPEWTQPLVIAVGVSALVAVVDYTLLLWREREVPPA